MNHPHLSPDVEFRYLITWFREFSDYEKSDFMDILIQWLLKTEEEAQLNGITDSCTKATIFYCRVSKLQHAPKSKWHTQNLIEYFR
jgi:hypothetical protein